MKFNQHINQNQIISQKQKLTPQLLQGVQLLQLSREELYSYLNQKALENPFIEVSTLDEPISSTTSIKEQNVNWVEDTYQSLYEFVTKQILLTYRPTYLRELLFWWVNQLDEKGYVTKTLEEAVSETGAEGFQMLDALTLLQQLEPAGIGARSLQECLMLQTERLNHAPNLAYIILEESFDDLINRNWEVLKQRYTASFSEIQEVYDFTQLLITSPGSLFERDSSSLVLPELIVSVKNDSVEVKESKYGIPLITFRQEYAMQLKQYDDEEVNKYINDKKKEYEALQESLRLRNETILRVGTAIVQKQKDFFLENSQTLAPLQLNDLAKELALHESTVSRAVQETYIQTAKGSIELKKLLSRKSSAKGKSTDTIQQTLKQLVDNEDKRKPLSDQKIADKLLDQGMELSRRTVTKYRKALGIPSSSNRKRYE